MSGGPAIVAVDVDGVVNALPRSDADLGHFSRWERRQVNGFLLTVAGEVVDWLTSLEERGGEFHWASTWTPMRHLLDDAFGLPATAPIAADPNAPVPPAGPGVSWKGAQIAGLVADHRRPLVWMDDDAITAPTQQLFRDLATRYALPMLAVVPLSRTGLRPADLATMDDFLARVRDGSAAEGLQVRTP